jgi:hypothetical protein
MVKLRIASCEVPELLSEALVPGAPVVVMPTATVPMPVAPVAPVGPATPVGPVGPVAPVDPVGPVAPAGPVVVVNGEFRVHDAEAVGVALLGVNLRAMRSPTVND